MSMRTIGRVVAALGLATLACAVVAADAQGAGHWAWPVRGPVITPYANDNAKPYAGGMHRGIDIAGPVGTAVVAARGGEVTYAGALGSAGITVAVRADGYATSYLHLASVSVAGGDHVEQGERIGAVGMTGRRSKAEPHLHFGVRLAGRERFYVDPMSLLPGMGERRASPTPVPVGPPLRHRAALRHPPHLAPQPAPVAHPRPDRDFGRVFALLGVALLFAALFGRALAAALRDANSAFANRLYGQLASLLRAIRHARPRRAPNAARGERYFASNR